MLVLSISCKAESGFDIFKYLTLPFVQSSSVIKKYNVAMCLACRVAHCTLGNPRTADLNAADDVPRFLLHGWR